MGRDESPLEYVADLEDRIKQFAKKHNLKIDWYYEPKIRWMEQHGGRCFCDWSSDRRCPCKHALHDIYYQYNGSCLCAVLLTSEKLADRNRQQHFPYKSINLPGGVLMSELKLYNKSDLAHASKKEKIELDKKSGKIKKRKSKIIAFP